MDAMSEDRLVKKGYMDEVRGMYVGDHMGDPGKDGGITFPIISLSFVYNSYCYMNDSITIYLYFLAT